MAIRNTLYSARKTSRGPRLRKGKRKNLFSVGNLYTAKPRAFINPLADQQILKR